MQRTPRMRPRLVRERRRRKRLQARDKVKPRMAAKSSKPSIIVGVHGLENKPPLGDAMRAWKSAISEGLVRNCGYDQGEIPFDLVYWADLRNDQPLVPDEIEEPYRPDPGSGPFPKPDADDRWSTTTIVEHVYKGLGWIQAKTGFTPFDDLILKAGFDDLWRYQSGTTFARQVRQRLCEHIKALAGHRILLVAHSMGALIAYDGLRLLERDAPSVWVDHFVTIGSPLGLAEVRLKIAAEHGAVRTPNNVGQWSNLSDKRDAATVADTLSADYAPSEHGVGIRDVAVLNAYRRPNGKPYHHMSFGYLRSPEFSEIVRSVLVPEKC
jgi:hypothetical protein